MCGILGLIANPWQAQAAQLLDCLKERGPDASTLLQLDGATLGHARLAVIDLVSGAQPMQSADKRYSIVFNGEIYNYRTLRTELEQLGHRFTTHSDTEVLLQAYMAWGMAALPRLDGMFAFAIHDAHTQQVFVARDRVGIKPLFYSLHRGLSISSTLEPFFHMHGFPRRIDYSALRDFLAFQTVMAPHSMLADVAQLPPAGWLRYDISRHQAERGQYWQIPHAAPQSPSFEEALADTDRAIAASVREQLVADVPLGAFLSGGIDSSLLVHYMAEAGARPLSTFSVRFADAGFDESKFAQQVADKYATDHHIIDAPQIDSAQFAAAINLLDQPLADPAYIPAQALARETRRHVTVAISGDGGDELFGGYARFLDEESNYPPTTAKKILRGLINAGLLPGSLLRRSLYGREMMLYRKIELGPWTQSRKSMQSYLSPQAWTGCKGDEVLQEWRDLVLSFSGKMDTDSLMRADLWSYLSENCLMKSDRASMAHSLEVRVPLLGNAVMDTALALPGKFHFAHGDKSLLRALAKRHLPESVWNREKHGFSVPLRNYLSGSWQEAAQHGIATLIKSGLVNPATVAEQWQATANNRGSHRLSYTLVVLGLWLERHAFSE